MSAHHRFELVTHWQLLAPIERVWEAISHPEDWPRWWPYVRAVTALRDGDRDGLGAVKRFAWDSRLPYGLAFDAETVEVQRPFRLRALARGELEGEGLWQLRSDGDGGTCVDYRWRVDLHRAWMRRLAPLAAPLFSWNHRGVMAAGGQGLARHLGVPLLVNA
jgi:uncharacterized protein YndB with AHSA1/START domain